MPTNDSLGWLLGMIVWVAFYFAGSWALWGKTIGRGGHGSAHRPARQRGLEPGRALLRALVFPLSFLTLGIGFAMALVEHEHRALHDVLAGTTVVYDWGACPPAEPARPGGQAAGVNEHGRCLMPWMNAESRRSGSPVTSMSGTRVNSSRNMTVISRRARWAPRQK